MHARHIKNDTYVLNLCVVKETCREYWGGQTDLKRILNKAGNVGIP